jgi:predicted enzyme related to lactoylglutathione lyase
MKTTTAIPVFQVSDVEASLKHYTGIFGFSEDFRFGDYAGIQLGDVRLHLSGHSVHERPVGGGTAYILCDEVDDYCAKIKKNGAIVKSDPKDYPYGMRDFMAVDPDGNHLAFGCEAKDI